MQGKINGAVSLVGTLSATSQLDGMIAPKGVLIGKASLPEYIDLPSYEGEYVAIPTSSEQTFETANKKMDSDFTVTATPYSEVSNIYGGYTVTIL